MNIKKIFFITTLQIFLLTYAIDRPSLKQKLGQLFIATITLDEQTKARKGYACDIASIKTLIQDHHIGGVIFLGKSNIEEQKQVTQELQTLSNTPLFICQDLEPGKLLRSRLPEFFGTPSAQELAKVNPYFSTLYGEIIGTLCNDIGVNVNFAPVVDVNSNPNNPIINDRSFSNTPEVVVKYATAFAQGLKNKSVISCAKHFPGHGDTTKDSHLTLPVIPHAIERLNAVELYPFTHIIKRNIPMIMIGHLSVPALDESETPATLSKKIVTEILQQELKFNGLIITDALDMRGLTNYYNDNEIALKALQAGNNLLLCARDIPAAIEYIMQNMTAELEKHINESYEKVMKLKKQYHIID